MMVGQASPGVNAELLLKRNRGLDCAPFDPLERIRLSRTEAGGEFIGVDLGGCIAPEKRIG
jgi:hypothetical protein